MDNFWKLKLLKAIIIVIVCISVSISCRKETTTPPNSNQNQYQQSPGLSSSVSALVTFNGNLIAANYNYVSVWNGSNWSSLGSEFSGTISALTVYNGNLIAAGATLSTDNGFVKMWNGSTWKDLGTGFDDFVNAVIVYNGNLIAGGNFDSLNGGTVNYIAQWNGSSWQKVGPGLRWFSFGQGFQINAFTLFNGNLVAGGQFDLQGASQISAGGVAQWDGNNWTLFGKGVGGTVNSLAEFNGNLIAGGVFVDVLGPSDTLKNIAQWNGSQWTTLGNSNIGSGYWGESPAVLTLTAYNNNLAVGGYFFSLGNNFTYGLAEWDGNKWSLPFGAIIDNPPYMHAPDVIYASIVYNGNLVIGGSFTNAGSVSANNIAQWNGSSWSAL